MEKNMETTKIYRAYYVRVILGLYNQEPTKTIKRNMPTRVVIIGVINA